MIFQGSSFIVILETTHTHIQSLTWQVSWLNFCHEAVSLSAKTYSPTSKTALSFPHPFITETDISATGSMRWLWLWVLLYTKLLSACSLNWQDHSYQLSVLQGKLRTLSFPSANFRSVLSGQRCWHLFWDLTATLYCRFSGSACMPQWSSMQTQYAT